MWLIYVPKRIKKTPFRGAWLAQLVAHAAVFQGCEFKPYVRCGTYLTKKKKKRLNCATCYNAMTYLGLNATNLKKISVSGFFKTLRQRLFLKIHFTLSVLSSSALEFFIMPVIAKWLFLTWLLKVDFTVSEITLVVDPWHKFNVFSSI